MNTKKWGKRHRILEYIYDAEDDVTLKKLSEVVNSNIKTIRYIIKEFEEKKYLLVKRPHRNGYRRNSNYFVTEKGELWLKRQAM